MPPSKPSRCRSVLRVGQPRRSDELNIGSSRADLALHDVLAVLDDLAEDADALNARIEALLTDGGRGSR